ncbi:26S proteasome non-ATPase regulatory subunit 5-like [Tropilaelaps mercedesae]|uniref:26S proteasome non-ATPase regulatory subunit 5 n=1 Tax=Tropilaelaps mercedesae TaxID=418985 RepID=A0A1V9XZX3_9ACAR|nr:26S proteasome non-ATPase regulatory subunit 5-like [Tropilaelaps mercedesae]
MRTLEELLRDLSDPAQISIENLNVIRAACADLVHSNRLEFSNHLQHSDLSKLFTILANLASDEVPAYCDVLKTLLDCLPPQQLLAKYEIFIGQVLREGSNDHIQRLALQQLHRCAQDSKVSSILIANPALMGPVVDRFASPTLNGQVRCLVLELTANSKDAVKLLFEGEILKHLQQVQEKGSVEKLRVFELYCQVACQSEENCAKMTARLESVVESMLTQRSDVLVLLNYVELLTVLGTKAYTMNFLFTSDAISILKDLLNAPEDPNATFYMPGVLLFFGELGSNNPVALIEDNKSIVSVIFTMATLGSLFAPTAMAAVAQICRTREGKRCLEQHFSREMDIYMRSLGECLETSKYSAEHKMSALNCVAAILEMDEFDQLDVINLTEKWFNLLSSGPLQMLWRCAKVPFETERLAVLRTLRHVALLPWGREGLLKLPGFYEWLLDRSTEPNKVGKEGKHAIAAALLEVANSIKDPAHVIGLRKFYAEGPFYSPSEVAVATESGA